MRAFFLTSIVAPIVTAMMCTTVPSAAAPVENVLYNFCSLPNCADGSGPYGPLIGRSGVLYGTTFGGGAYGGGTVFSLTPPNQTGGAWTETVLWSFTNGSDGCNPIAGLLAKVDTTGAIKALYGTTQSGGGGDLCTDGSGTVFMLTPPAVAGGPWTETTLWHFSGGADGGGPNYGSLVTDTNGALYGMTTEGGPSTSPAGVVYRLAPPAGAGGAWTETVLYNFCSLPACADGSLPWGGLLRVGFKFYGTTYSGGAGGSNCGGECGTVFELQPLDSMGNSWRETVLHSFCAHGACSPTETDGSRPYDTLTADPAGALYGTAWGGTLAGGGGGIVFKLVPPTVSGGRWTERILNYFAGGSINGSNPVGGVLLAGGALYGTTFHGGNTGCGGSGEEGCGTVFQLGSASAIYRFAHRPNDGAQPNASLLGFGQASGTRLFGTTTAGGTNNSGTVFTITFPP